MRSRWPLLVLVLMMVLQHVSFVFNATSIAVSHVNTVMQEVERDVSVAEARLDRIQTLYDACEDFSSLAKAFMGVPETDYLLNRNSVDIARGPDLEPYRMSRASFFAIAHVFRLGHDLPGEIVTKCVLVRLVWVALAAWADDASALRFNWLSCLDGCFAGELVRVGM